MAVTTTSNIPDPVRWQVVERDAANLPQSAQAALFTVTGAPIEVGLLIGTVVTGIQVQANNTKVVANPSGGTDTDMCTVLDISGDAGGEMYTLSGTGSVLQNTTTSGAIDLVPSKTYYVNPGTIDLNCAASNTGTIGWRLVWRSMDAVSPAVVTAA